MKISTYTVSAAVTLFILTGCQGQNRGVNLASSSSTTTTTTTSTLPPPTYFTTAQTMSATTTIKTLTWNLGTQMNGTSPLPGGGTFTITVQQVTSTSGQPNYQFGNPTATGGASAILLQNIGFMINGQQEPLAQVFTGVNRMVPASASRVLASATQVIPVSAFAATDTLSITFGNLIPTVFAPPTYTTLKSATGVFGANCISCHTTANAQGGLDLTNYINLTDIIQSGYFPVVAFNPSDSLVLIRMSNSNGAGYMPATGPLSGTAQQQVSDWINDGAPNN